MDKAEWDARANAGSIKRIAAALRARDEEISRLKGIINGNLELSRQDAGQLMANYDELQKIRAERDAAADCVAALRDILSTLSLEWWTQQFVRDEAPQGAATGIIARIQNTEMRSRAVEVLERGRAAIAQLPRAAERARLVDAVVAAARLYPWPQDHVKIEHAIAALDAHDQGAGGGDA